MSSSIVYRPVLRHEQSKAIELWQSAFEPKADGYFERYFASSASPLYHEGDTLGAWTDDDRLVSVVQIRRMRMRSNETLLCGVISNVATDVEFRNRGLSKALLRQATEKMQADRFDLSMLGTGRSQHYASLGWEPLTMSIQYVITATPDRPATVPHESVWTRVPSYDQLFEIYSRDPRPYQFDRCSPSTFEDWIGWHWQTDDAYVHVLPDRTGYAVISQADGQSCPPCIAEYRAVDRSAEVLVLHTAAEEIRRRYRHRRFLLQTLPQHATLGELGWNGEDLICERNEDMMIQNIRLSDEEYQSVKRAFEAKDGKGTVWPGEYF